MTLAEMNARKKELLAQADALIAKKQTEFTEDDSKKVESLNAEIAALNGQIEANRKQAENLAALKKQREVLAGANTELELEDGTQIEVGEKNIIKAPHAGFADFGAHLMAIREAAVNPLRTDKRLIDYRAAATGGNILSGADGGFLLTPVENQSIFTKVFTDDIDLAQVQKYVLTNTNACEVNALVDNDRSSITTRYGGVAVYWLKEAGTPTSGKPQFGKVKFELNYLVGLAYATEQELRYVANYGERLYSLMGAAIAGELKEAVMFGTGAGKPLGVFNANNAARLSTAKETVPAAQVADTVIAENISKMWQKVHTASKARGKWFYNFEVAPQLDKMYIAVGASGIPVYMPMGGFSGLPYATLKGRPAIEDEHMEKVGDCGDIGFADFSQYGIATDGATIGGTQMAMSMHVAFTTLENAFRIYTAIDGKPLWNTYLTPRKATSASYQSPFVVLAERA